MLANLRKTYNEYPKTFWVVMFGMFIDNIGSSLLFPFLTLYVTRKFGVSLIDIGWIHMVSTIINISGSTIGGALADKYGRKTIGLVGLFCSALITIPLGLANSWQWFIVFNLAASFLGHFAGPAFNALLTDLLPEEKRNEGFGAMYVVGNLSAAIGPIIGGLLINYSFLWIFIADCVLSCITGIILIFKMPETRPDEAQRASKVSIKDTFAGYGTVIKDRVFVTLVLLIVLTMMVYMNYNSTLSVYLNRLHGISAQRFGYLLTLNASMVVIFQMTVSRITQKYNRNAMMFLGTFLYAIGFSLIGFGTSYGWFVFAFVIITIGEMISSPLYQTIAADFAPVDMRARYMAFMNISYSFAHAVGPLAAGYVMETSRPQWVWYGGGIICLIAAVGFAFSRMRRRVGRSEKLVKSSETA